MDLTGVKVIADFKTGESPTKIIPLMSSTTAYLAANPYFILYKIDPCGVLFGNTTCGINNYQNFIVYNPPYVSNYNSDTSNIYNCYDNL
jgi:hypothetical protein